MVAAPFLWIIGGVIWMVAHGIHQNGPIAALLAGSGATFICGAFITLLASGGSDSSLAGAFSGFVLLAALSAFGALGAAIVWIIAYKGRPVRRSYGMGKP